MNRRTILKGGLVLAATAHTPVSTSEAATDPLAQTIRAYRAGVAAINAIPIEGITLENEQRLIEAAYGRHEAALLKWDQPATSKEGAMEALRMASEEAADYAGSAMVLPMLTAALAYFERVSS